MHGEQADWSVTDHLLAAVVDQLAVANWMFATVNRDEDTDPAPYPEPLPRPGREDQPAGAEAVRVGGGEAPGASPADIVAFLSTP
ncbi:hypothetical protein [Streptomyces geranii]|uniref:hypothetical protein n=1 Tax=Streptomyces geranii TaxID=2058923 RepID=UPI0038CD3653